jgi:hypothetical protein
MEQRFLFTYHPSIFHGTLVAVGSLTPPDEQTNQEKASKKIVSYSTAKNDQNNCVTIISCLFFAGYS